MASSTVTTFELILSYVSAVILHVDAARSEDISKVPDCALKYYPTSSTWQSVCACTLWSNDAMMFSAVLVCPYPRCGCMVVLDIHATHGHV